MAKRFFESDYVADEDLKRSYGADTERFEHCKFDSRQDDQQRLTSPAVRLPVYNMPGMPNLEVNLPTTPARARVRTTPYLLHVGPSSTHNVQPNVEGPLHDPGHIEEQDIRKRITEQLCPGLNGLRTKYLVAPVGSIDDPVISIADYHNMTTFSGSGFASIHDLASPSPFVMYTKLGQIDAGKRKMGMLHFVVRSQVFNVEPDTPTLCNFKVFKNHKKARQVGNLANPYL
jgi:hypothetical protein